MQSNYVWIAMSTCSLCRDTLKVDGGGGDNREVEGPSLSQRFQDTWSKPMVNARIALVE